MAVCKRHGELEPAGHQKAGPNRIVKAKAPAAAVPRKPVGLIRRRTGGSGMGDLYDHIRQLQGSELRPEVHLVPGRGANELDLTVQIRARGRPQVERVLFLLACAIRSEQGRQAPDRARPPAAGTPPTGQLDHAAGREEGP